MLCFFYVTTLTIIAFCQAEKSEFLVDVCGEEISGIKKGAFIDINGIGCESFENIVCFNGPLKYNSKFPYPLENILGHDSKNSEKSPFFEEASKNGGLLSFSWDPVLFTKSSDFNNEISEGCGISMKKFGYRNISLTNSIFSHNFALGDGGDIYIDYEDVSFSIINVTTSNSSSQGNGGSFAIYIENNYEKTNKEKNYYNFSDCYFVNCSCVGCGGAIYVSDKENNLEGEFLDVWIVNTKFSDCRCGLRGGAICFEPKGRIIIDKCVFNGCRCETAGNSGGAVYALLNGKVFFYFLLF
jgi:hypothetical protein